MSLLQCPICKKPVESEGEHRSKWFPFCSERCKLIDLGRWLSGKYQVPVSGPSEEEGMDPPMKR